MKKQITVKSIKFSFFPMNFTTLLSFAYKKYCNSGVDYFDFIVDLANRKLLNVWSFRAVTTGGARGAGAPPIISCLKKFFFKL